MARLPFHRVISLSLLALLITGVGTPLPAEAQSSCSFDGKLKISPENIVTESAPILGNRSSDVLLIEFFDPNCHPCQRLHPVIKDVVDKYEDRMTFYMHPIPVWRYSVRQIESLLLAKEKGKYYEMIDYQLHNQQKGGLTVDQIVTMADSIGIDPSWMRTQLTEEDMREQVGRISFQAQKAGVKSTPTLAIGRNIISSAQPTACIGQLVERTLQDRAETGGEE